MKKKIITLFSIILVSVSVARAQETEIKISLSEQFFDALLEAVFTNMDAPKVPLSLAENRTEVAAKSAYVNAAFESRNADEDSSDEKSRACDETVRLKKAVDGVRTAVRFRNGKILAPIAFEGNYNPPLIGCIGFSGWAETSIDLKFDQNKNALVGQAKVLNVNLSGTNGIGSSLVTRLVQNSIDKKINPLEIVRLDTLSFVAPIQDAGKLRMKAIGIRHVVKEKEIEVFLKYRFEKP